MAVIKKRYLSVVIPCYNERENLQRGVLDKVEKYLARQSYSSEVIISDDGSTDESLDFLERFIKNHPRFKLLKNSHQGKSFAIRAAVRKAKGEIILFTDMDQSTPINQIKKLLLYFHKGFDIVIGSRGRERTGFSLLRQLASNIFRRIRQFLLLRNIIDTQCGFKAFKNQVAKDLFSRLLIFKKSEKVEGWRVGAFDVELLFIAQKRGYKIAEVAVEWEDKDVTLGKQRHFARESLEMFKEILRVRLNDWKGCYD